MKPMTVAIPVSLLRNTNVNITYHDFYVKNHLTMYRGNRKNEMAGRKEKLALQMIWLQESARISEAI